MLLAVYYNDELLFTGTRNECKKFIRSENLKGARIGKTVRTEPKPEPVVETTAFDLESDTIGFRNKVFDGE